MAELDDLAEGIVAWAGHLAAGTARWLRLIARFDRLEGFARYGCQSTAHWLNWACALDLRAAREHVRVARRLEELPQIRETFERGELSYSKVRAITRIATVDTEEDLVMLATHAPAAHVERIVATIRRVGEHVVTDAQRIQDRRELWWYHDDDGMLVLRARLAPEAGAVVRKAIDHALGTEPGEGFPHQRRADALLSLAAAYLDGVAQAHSRERYQVFVHVDADVLAADAADDDGQGRCHLDDVPTIPAETARRLACDATIVKVLEGPTEATAVGRRTKVVPVAVRRLLHARDQGTCRFAGCVNRRVHHHHIRHWAHGGPTDVDNLLTLCTFHHRLVHEGGWTVEWGGQGRVRFTDRNGWTPSEVAALEGSAEHLHASLTPLTSPGAITGRWAGERLHLDHICSAWYSRPDRAASG